MDDNIQEVINILGIKQYHIKGDELGTLCLNENHNDTKLGNFFINLNTGQFHCFSCHYAGNIVYLLNKFGASYTQSFAIWNKISHNREVELYIPDKPIDRYIIQAYKDNGISEYAFNRVKDSNILVEYNVFSDENRNPIFLPANERNQIMSIWVRENDKYYLIEPLNAKRNGVLFGEHLYPTEYTVLTEGPFDALAVRKLTGQRGICGFGTYLSTVQLAKLRKMPNLLIMMDGDTAGREARDRIVNYLYDKPDLYIAGGYMCDPDEMKDMDNIIITSKRIDNYNMFRLMQGYKYPKRVDRWQIN